MNLILAIVLYAGLAVFAFGIILLLFFLIFKKRLKAPLIICLIGLIIAASPVGYNFYMAQKEHREELAKIEKKDKNSIKLNANSSNILKNRLLPLNSSLKSIIKFGAS